jgi:hypothetical protein
MWGAHCGALIAALIAALIMDRKRFAEHRCCNTAAEGPRSGPRSGHAAHGAHGLLRRFVQRRGRIAIGEQWHCCRGPRSIQADPRSAAGSAGIGPRAKAAAAYWLYLDEIDGDGLCLAIDACEKGIRTTFRARCRYD